MKLVFIVVSMDHYGVGKSSFISAEATRIRNVSPAHAI